MKKIILLALVIVSFAAGVYIGRLPIMDVFLGARTPAPVQVGTQEISQELETVPSVQSEKASYQVSSNQLTSGQRDLLSKFGIDANAITITPTMIACAEAKLGAARLAEIQAGATPTFTEGAALLACYR